MCFDDLTEFEYENTITFNNGVFVFKRCPTCGKFIKEGNVLENGLEEIALKNWICKKCGEVIPNWGRL